MQDKNVMLQCGTIMIVQTVININTILHCLVRKDEDEMDSNFSKEMIQQFSKYMCKQTKQVRSQ